MTAIIKGKRMVDMCVSKHLENRHQQHINYILKNDMRVSKTKVFLNYSDEWITKAKALRGIYNR